MIAPVTPIPTASRTRIDLLQIARMAVHVIVIGSAASPPLANLGEAVLLLCLLASAELRARLFALVPQPAVRWALVFFGLVTLAVLWSVGTPEHAHTIWGGWRKILVLPIAMALFHTAAQKRALAVTLVCFMTLAAVLSAASYFSDWQPMGERGVILQFHMIQGMAGGVGMMAALALALFPAAAPVRAAPRALFWLAALGIFLMVGAMTPGRSGYLVVVICSLVLSWQWLRSSYARMALPARVAGLLLPLLVVGGLAATPQVQRLVTKASEEFGTWQNSDVNTSMGLRVYLWSNTVDLIRARPLTGYGTGSFIDIYGAKVAGRTGMAGDVRGDPHNQFMKIWAEQGLAGLLIFATFIVALLRAPASQPWRALAMGPVLAWCVTSLASSHFSMFSEGTFLYAWCGAMLGLEWSSDTGVDSGDPAEA